MKEAASWVEVEGVSAVEVTGEDRLSWLQGQATQDMLGRTPGSSSSALFLSPAGAIQAIARVGFLEDRVILVTENPEVILDRVERFVIMEDVAARVLPGPVTTIQGPGLDDLFPQESGPTWVRSRRSLAGGWDLFGDVGEALAPYPQAEKIELDIAMLLALEPWAGKDTTPKSLPSDYGDDFFNAHVSTSKGCYQGQEVVHRIYARGAAPRKWVVEEVEAEEAPTRSEMRRVLLKGNRVLASAHERQPAPQ
jgi:folate-binding protein YgfZ